MGPIRPRDRYACLIAAGLALSAAGDALLEFPRLLAYVIVIGIMIWRAAARVGGTAPSWFAAIGAVLFGMSDTLIALDRFHSPIPGARYPISPPAHR